MVVIHGDDFLRSLQDLFEEAGERGRDVQANFDLFKEPLVQYIKARQFTTAAKARASLKLQFTDRRRPETVVQLPPTTLKVDEAGADKLRDASSGNEFIGLLRVMIDEGVAANAPKPTGKRKRPTKAQRRAMEEAKYPQTKIRVKPRTTFDSEQAAWEKLKVHGLPTFISKSTPTQFPDRQQKLEVNVPIPSIEKFGGQGMDIGKDFDVDSPKKDFFSSSRTAIATGEGAIWDRGVSMQTINTDMLNNFLDGATNDLMNPTETKERMVSPELGYEVVHHLSEEEDIDMAEDAHARIEDSNEMTAVNSSLDSEHGRKQSQDSQMRSEDDNVSYYSLPDEDMDIAEATTPETLSEETSEDSLQFLKSAISRLEPEIADIRPDKWDEYQAKLFQLCDNHNLFTLPFKERLNKMVRIIYLNEEEEAIKTKDWSKLGGVVKICAFLAETTGPALEPADERMVNGWVIGRLRDIKFLVWKAKIFELTAESEIE